MASKCPNCGNEISDRNEGAKFCSLRCKNRYNYHNKGNLKGTPKTEEQKDNPLEKTLRGLIENESPQEQESGKTEDKPYKEKVYPDFEVDFTDPALFFDGLENKDMEINTDKPQTKENIPLPPMYIEKETKTESALYKDKQKYLKEMQARKAGLEKDYKTLEEQLKQQQDRNGNQLIWLGSFGGGLFGLMNAGIGKEEKNRPVLLKDFDEDKKESFSRFRKKKKKGFMLEKKDPTIAERFVKALLYGAIGAGIGFAGKALTEGYREKDKQKQIAAIKKRMEEINRQLKSLIITEIGTANILKMLPQYETKKEKISNPEYQKALNGLQAQKAQKQTPVKNIHSNKVPIKFKSDKIIRATDLGNMEYKALNFQGLWKEFFGSPSTNFHCLIHGNSGEGKSTFCMWFARYLAENFGRVLYVSGEEGVNKTFQDKLKFCEAEVDGFFILDVRTGDDFLKEVGENEFHFIIIDSLHDMNIDARKMKEIMEKYKNTAFIAIDQNNKKGELLGANEKKHIQDIVVNVKDFTAETTKNRFKAKGIVCKTANFIETVKPDGERITGHNGQTGERKEGR